MNKMVRKVTIAVLIVALIISDVFLSEKRNKAITAYRLESL